MVIVETFFNKPKHAGQAAYVARICERAENLFGTGGYTYLDMEDGDFNVFKPDWNGDPADVYTVKVNPPHCGCPGFEKDKDCKHRIACAIVAYDKNTCEQAGVEW